MAGDLTGMPAGSTPLHDAAGRRLQRGLPVSFPEHVHGLIEAEIVSGGLVAGDR